MGLSGFDPSNRMTKLTRLHSNLDSHNDLL